jgi:ribonuclease R
MKAETPYAVIIPEREVILAAMKAHGAPLPREDIAHLLGLRGEDYAEALRRRLNAMLRDGQLLENRRGELCLVEKTDLIAGRVEAHPDGFGFLEPEAGGKDVFLSPKQMRTLMHGDRALVRIKGFDRRGRPEGSLVEVLERAHSEVIGRLLEEAGIAHVAPEDRRLTHDVLIPPGARGGAKAGDWVVARLTEYPQPHQPPLGRVTEVLRNLNGAGRHIEIALRSHHIPCAWPPAAEQEAAQLPLTVKKPRGDTCEDLRGLPLVTIDGADSRDFDDAVFAEPVRGGWRLIVAIADVSHYVRSGSALDAEAQQRATSVYFPNRVVPMLPEALSNGLCSLNPDVDRLCLACEMKVNTEGEVTRARFLEGIMRSQARLTYDEVAAIVAAREPTARARRGALTVHLDHLYALYGALRQAREARHALDFDTQEARFHLSPQGEVEAIVPLRRNDAHKLIEECMIAANVEAAKFLLKKKLPALYRVHEGVHAEKLEDLLKFLGGFGLHLPGGRKPRPADYAAVLAKVRARPDAHLIETVMLRSLTQAVYTPDNQGHFGLALEAYAHFTSPIRRYPDLLVHRAIRHALRGGKAADYVHGASEMRALGEQCSLFERRADEATREVAEALKCEYMASRVGCEYGGVVSGVTSFGVFVELDETRVSGLIHISMLGQDYFHFDPVRHALTGERTRVVYRLGERIRVRVLRVNLEERKVDFEPVSLPSALHVPSAPAPGRAGNKAKRGGGRRQRRR